ncbi:TIGR01777 family oxidoreductase, partial [Mycobacterium sp. E3247]|uniref:TIGR01777 family oxidoreductase n=1 Tax=Mycobacterium sp. E3247 TaxID=1856864 RepID=UPI000AECBD11
NRVRRNGIHRTGQRCVPQCSVIHVDAVIHLAGESIAGRFTERHRKAIRDSRIGPTRWLAEALARTPRRPSVLVTASAIGYYGYDRGDDVLTEDSERGDGFLADVVADWEAATAPAEQAGVRVVPVRTGIVQSPRGGTLKLMRPLFSAGLGGRLGDGRQWLSWIGIDDLVDVYHRALWDTALSGPVNAVAPHPVRNSEYTATLAHVMRRPAVLPVPSLGPRVLLGEQGARELACASQRVAPQKLTAAGHRFRHPELEQALRHLLGRES